MSTKTWAVILGIPAIIIAVVAILLIIQNNPGSQQPGTENIPGGSSTTPDQNQKMPQISENDPNVQQIILNYSPTLARYMFTGTIKELKQTSQGTELVLVTKNTNLPQMIITVDTRIQRYDSVTTKTTQLTENDLHPGLVLDLTLDYEKNNKVWFFRDIYVPTDRN